ncbi:unnamed protein product, partial [marine sediment metagenome]
ELFMSKLTGAMKMIDYSHHEIHGGGAYTLSQRSAVNAFDIAAPMSFSIVTPNTTRWAHMVISGECNTPAFWELFEDNGVAANFDVAGGVIVNSINRNRNSANASGLLVTTAPVITQATVAALIASEAIAKSSSGGERHEFMLRQNTQYLVRATSYADNNEGSLSLNWYEHTDKSY